jgi:tetratricopeptide (TPR) repeat protein
VAQQRKANAHLSALLSAADLSHASVARVFVRVALENGASEFAGVGRSHVSHWVAGTRPSGRGPIILCEALSRLLGRMVVPADIGLADSPTNRAATFRDAIDWHEDTLAELTHLGRDDVNLGRRSVLGGAAYSIAALTLPDQAWWQQMTKQGRAREPVGPTIVSRGDVEAVRDMVSMLSSIDQRRGGGHARAAALRYLTVDVARYLHGTYRDEELRRDMFSTASELAYLVGWMAFDNAEHGIAQRFFTVAVKLASEADDPPMAGHILRAMAHQAVDLGHTREALALASASLDGRRYALAAPRERALLGVVHARALAISGQSQDAAAALLRAENDLASAAPGDDEPGRVFFFGEASLAHETACALRDSGDLSSAISQFRRSVRTRKAATFTRTHAVTLGYLGAIQIQQGNLEQACSTWSTALDAMNGIRSGRTRQLATDMRSLLTPFHRRGISAATDVDRRAAAYLAGVA